MAMAASLLPVADLRKHTAVNCTDYHASNSSGVLSICQQLDLGLQCAKLQQLFHSIHNITSW